MTFLLLFLASFSWAPAHAEGFVSHADSVLIKNADSMYSDKAKQTMRLEGNVLVAFQDQVMSCDKAFINGTTQTIVAEGHVILESMKIHIEGTRLTFNYKTNTGVIENGFVKSGQVVFEGEWINKTGPESYVAQNAEFTACDTCPPGWAFSGRTIEAEMGAYAYIHRPIFKIAGVPIFIFPAMTVPLKSKRQSGFLVPSLAYSSLGGAGFGESFFWAIDKSRDLTLTAVNWGKRGPELEEDYRYVLSPDSKGRMEGSYLLSDRALSAEYLLPKPEERWFAHYQHFFELPDDFVNRLEIKQVSDVRYPRDFQEEMPGLLGDPSLESRLSLSKNAEISAFSVEATMNDNLLKYSPYSDNSDAVQKMPEIRYSGRERRIFNDDWGPLFRWDMDYSDFARDQYSYDTLTIDKTINPQTAQPFGYLTGTPIGQGIQHCPFNMSPSPVNGQCISSSSPLFGAGSPPYSLIRTGQRVDIQPTLSYPFQIAHRFDILPSISYREMQYRFDLPEGAESDGYSESAARRYVETSVTARTEMSTVYGDLDDEKSNRWKHSIEPELTYDELPWMRSPNDPFFGNWTTSPYYLQNYPIGDADVNGPNKLQFDYYDRVFDRKLTTLALTNSLTHKTWLNGDPSYQRVVLFRLQQSYDFDQQDAGAHQPWSPTDALLNATFKNFETYSTASYNRYANITNVSITGKLLLNPKNYLLMTYSHNYLIDQINDVQPGTESRLYGGGVGFTTKYVDVGSVLNYSTMPTRGISSFDVFGIIRPPGNCWHLKVMGHQDLGGQTSWHFDFSFDFTGGANPNGSAGNSTKI